MSDIIVSVIMLSYNQEAYIAQSIEGVFMQQTDFAYELIVGDDCSSDRSAAIISEYEKQYPAVIKTQMNDCNVGSIENELKLLSAAQGKYISFCEADDYWTDPYKLQKQVDFLESNPEYGLVHGDVDHFDQKTSKVVKAYNKTNNIIIPSGDIFNFLMRPSHSIKTMTVCFRRDLFEKYYLQDNEIMSKDWRLIDISIWLTLAHYTKFHYIDEVLATYRILPESMSRTKNPEKLYRFHQRIHEIRAYFAKKYDMSDELYSMIKEQFYRSNLTDGYNIRNKIISSEAFNYLKQLGANLSLKEMLLYHGTKHNWLRNIIRMVRSR